MLLKGLNHSFLRVDERGPTGEHVGQHVFGDLWAADSQGVAGILHFAQALPQRVQLLGHLVGARVPDVGESVVDLPQELAQLEGRVDVAVAHAADAHPHQLSSQVGHAEQVVWGRHLEGQDLSSHGQGFSWALRWTHREKKKNLKITRMATKERFWTLFGIILSTLLDKLCTEILIPRLMVTTSV